MNILFVCIGNICRSPIAEGVMKDICFEKKLNWNIDSAAIMNYHIGETPHRLSQKVCDENGINISLQKARLIEMKDFELFDKIYGMEKEVVDFLKKFAENDVQKNKIDFFLNEIYPGENRNLKDPWYGEWEDYVEVFEEIKKTCIQIEFKYNV